MSNPDQDVSRVPSSPSSHLLIAFTVESLHSPSHVRQWVASLFGHAPCLCTNQHLTSAIHPSTARTSYLPSSVVARATVPVPATSVVASMTMATLLTSMRPSKSSYTNPVPAVYLALPTSDPGHQIILFSSVMFKFVAAFRSSGQKSTPCGTSLTSRSWNFPTP